MALLLTNLLLFFILFLNFFLRLHGDSLQGYYTKRLVFEKKNTSLKVVRSLIKGVVYLQFRLYVLNVSTCYSIIMESSEKWKQQMNSFSRAFATTNIPMKSHLNLLNRFHGN